MIGIVLFSLFLGVSASDSIDLQYHTVNYLEIEWQKLAQLGINQVTIRTYLDLPENGGLYFNNGQFRVIEDRLNERFIPVWKKRAGLRIVGWLISRKYNWLNKKEWFDMSSGEDGERVPIPKIDLFNPDAVAAVVKTYADLAKSGVDGVLIQDDLIIKSAEGMSNWGKAAYTTQTRFPVEIDKMLTKGSPEQQNWSRVKINQVNGVVAQIVKACKEANPNCRVAMNVYYETPLWVGHGENWYSHNLAELIQTGIDEVALMAYHRQMAKEWSLPYQTNDFIERYSDMVNRAQAICGERFRLKIQIRDWDSGERVPLSEVDELLNHLAKVPARISLTPVKPGDIDWIDGFIQNLERKK